LFIVVRPSKTQLQIMRTCGPTNG